MSRVTIPLSSDWRFSRMDPDDAMDPGYDDSQWRAVRVPHDWAIEGPFDPDNDLQYTEIIEDGERQKSKHTGRTAGLPHVGPAWYRTILPEFNVGQGGRVLVEFDGAMSDSTVYCNGNHIGSWPFGYSSFSMELTDSLSTKGTNTLAVRLDPKADASRWYPGAGLYRHVRLVTVAPAHVTHWDCWRGRARTSKHPGALFRHRNGGPDDHDQAAKIVGRGDTLPVQSGWQTLHSKWTSMITLSSRVVSMTVKKKRRMASGNVWVEMDPHD